MGGVLFVLEESPETSFLPRKILACHCLTVVVLYCLPSDKISVRPGVSGPGQCLVKCKSQVLLVLGGLVRPDVAKH